MSNKNEAMLEDQHIADKEQLLKTLTQLLNLLWKSTEYTWPITEVILNLRVWAMIE